jgi:hypothetical protein
MSASGKAIGAFTRAPEHTVACGELTFMSALTQRRMRQVTKSAGSGNTNSEAHMQNSETDIELAAVGLTLEEFTEVVQKTEERKASVGGPLQTKVRNVSE